MTKSNSQSAKWAQWRWSKGLGRWHRLFTDGDLTRTACDTPRKSGSHVAETTAGKPSNPVCPICKSLDELLDRVMSGALTDAVAGVESTITIPAATEKPLAPVGMCLCGCDKTDEGVAYRAALKVWEADEAARKRAEFDAYLVEQGIDGERAERLSRIAEVYPAAAREAAEA